MNSRGRGNSGDRSPRHSPKHTLNDQNGRDFDAHDREVRLAHVEGENAHNLPPVSKAPGAEAPREG